MKPILSAINPWFWDKLKKHLSGQNIKIFSCDWLSRKRKENITQETMKINRELYWASVLKQLEQKYFLV